MAYAIDQATLDALRTGEIIDRGMILFDLGSGFYGFWTGIGILSYGGVNYIGAGSLIEVEALSQVTDGSAVPVLVTLNAIPNSELTPDVLATIENEQYHQRPVIIRTAYFSADTGALISVETDYRGYVDRVEHSEEIGGAAVLRAFLESKARDYLKTGYRTRGDADQKLISATDGFFQHAGTAATETIPWGRAEAETA